MTTVQHLFEAHVAVANLEASIAFYRDVVGLELGYTISERQAAFFWIGARGRAMLGVWAAGSAPQRFTTHIAFASALDDVLAAPQALRAAGVAPLDFDGQPTNAPVVIGWMPAACVYFRDPDGHLLEYVAMLPDPPRPEYGILSWDAWKRRQRGEVAVIAAAASEEHKHTSGSMARRVLSVRVISTRSGRTRRRQPPATPSG